MSIHVLTRGLRRGELKPALATRTDAIPRMYDTWYVVRGIGKKSYNRVRMKRKKTLESDEVS